MAFMLDCVPEPVCQTTSGKLSSSLPSITSSAASAIAVPIFSSRLFIATLVVAAQRLTMPSARIKGLGRRSSPILKFSRDRCVCAPQYLSAGTSIGPNESVSVRVVIILSSIFTSAPLSRTKHSRFSNSWLLPICSTFSRKRCLRIWSFHNRWGKKDRSHDHIL